MNKEDIEKYIKVIEINPDSKYILVLSQKSGITGEDLMQLKLNENFLDEILILEGDLNEVIRVIPTTKKQDE